MCVCVCVRCAASIIHVTHAVHETASAAQHCVDRHEKDITLPLQHLSLYCRAVCVVLQRREQLSSDVMKLNDTLTRKLCELQKVCCITPPPPLLCLLAATPNVRQIG